MGGACLDKPGQAAGRRFPAVILSAGDAMLGLICNFSILVIPAGGAGAEMKFQFPSRSYSVVNLSLS
jgi:hypothetical protein